MLSCRACCSYAFQNLLRLVVPCRVCVVVKDSSVRECMFKRVVCLQDSARVPSECPVIPPAAGDRPAEPESDHRTEVVNSSRMTTQAQSGGQSAAVGVTSTPSTSTTHTRANSSPAHHVSSSTGHSVDRPHRSRRSETSGSQVCHLIKLLS